jgi:ABC-type transport system substrate-binding protein
MEMEKKNLAIIILAIVLAASGIGNIILGVQLGLIEVEAPEYETFTRAFPSGPQVLDPVDSWEQAANEIIRQVAEPLFYYNWTDYNMGRINMLADTFTWESTTELSVTVRQNVKFHDGTTLDAEAVKWNLDRLMLLMNQSGWTPATGEPADPTDEGRLPSPHSLYENPAGDPLMKEIEVTDTFTVSIHLWEPFSTLPDLLCYTSGVIISPSAHSGDARSFIELEGGDLVGTGPYKYDEYIAEQEVKFTRWDDYWGGPNAHEGDVVHFEKMVYAIIDDPNTRNYAMLSHDVDWVAGLVADLFDIYRDDPTIAFTELDNAGLGISYLGFNNRQINVTWRKAMIWCFNYSYMVTEYWQDRVFRSYGWVSPGYGDWYSKANQEDVAPYFNVTIARMILTGNDPTPYPVPGIPEAAGRDPLDDGDWGLGANELVEYNYSYNVDNQWRADLFTLLTEYWSNISIALEDGGTDWVYFLYRAYGYVPGGYDELQVYWVGWGPDYLDPLNMMQPLLSNASAANSAQVNDPTMEAYFAAYALEQDLATKKEMMWNMSFYCITELHSHLFGYHGKGTTCHSADIYYDVAPALRVNVYSFLRYDFYAYPLRRNTTYVWP